VRACNVGGRTCFDALSLAPGCPVSDIEMPVRTAYASHPSRSVARKQHPGRLRTAVALTAYGAASRIGYGRFAPATSCTSRSPGGYRRSWPPSVASLVRPALAPRQLRAGDGLALQPGWRPFGQGLPPAAPLVGGASGFPRCRLVEVPVDIELVAGRGPELYAIWQPARAPASKWIAPPLAQPRASRKTSSSEPTSNEVVESVCFAARRAPDEGDPVVVRANRRRKTSRRGTIESG